MAGYARVVLSSSSVLVRFEQVDEPGSLGKFDCLRDDFYKAIPTARWDKKIRWMIVPNRELGKVLDFCYRKFGPGKVEITHNAPTSAKMEQLPLAQNWSR